MPSTGPDLLKFGNAILYSLQNEDGIIKSATVKQFRDGMQSEATEDKLGTYGFGLDREKTLTRPWLENYLDGFGHTGGAIDASSIIRIYPFDESDDDPVEGSGKRPRGMVVVILTNCYGVSCRKLAQKIAQNYLD